ncbi:hypothetical protein Rsub_05435 [Raphidocelis subcapitata]|uniref:Serine/threonine-protein phosphatase 2A 55 kDa regulatory subunit B n=1 Tax=Raphidocelis subcapitata TaxID=307507 RepID=A0A2V0NYX2_9CHLO|nr:hypothetical protein Rsub_05435 [Raphidocelis subcapitata]|eukprot:GBF92816.1 hypothetical protein Rsub_05435 [Raphidocelis subcapitata]
MMDCDKRGAEPLSWSFLQCFGERTPGEEVQEADIISAVEFNADGSFLATGDKGGRVVLFERVPMQQRYVGMDARAAPPPRGPGFEYRYLTEFQSHEPEFDYLKSLEIEEKINKVRWVRGGGCGGAKHVISTNDKTVKLWKVYNKRVVSVAGFNAARGSGSSTGTSSGGGSQGAAGGLQQQQQQQQQAQQQQGGPPPPCPLRLPAVVGREVLLSSRPRRVFANAHAYHINSISVSSDQETFLSADDLRVNLWNLEVADRSFNIVDIKPANMEDLTEVITSAEFHPRACNVFAYSSSKGCIRLADMRGAALCDRAAKAFEEADAAGGAKSFFSEIIASISDVRFSGDGRYLVSRDYMAVKVWDLAMERAPVATFSVHEGLRQRLCDLYENDCIFDKFDCCMNGAATAVASGTYSNSFRVFGVGDGGAAAAAGDATLEATRDPMRRRAAAGAGGGGGGAPAGKAARFGAAARGKGTPGKRSPGEAPEAAAADYGSKLLHLAWHPEADVIACAASNSLYMYCA